MLHQVESAYRTREDSAAQLRRFVADASHELRTPLSAIRGYLQLYDQGMLSDPDERKRAWGRVMAEADRMGLPSTSCSPSPVSTSGPNCASGTST